MAAQIHPSAFVDSKAVIGEDVVIGPCAVVEANTVIGDRCRIDAFASVKQYTRMGTDNHIYSYAAVGGEPQDLKFHGEESWLEIGDRNRIREFATLHRGTEGGGAKTVVGSDNLLMAYTHVAHDCHVKDGIIMSNGATLAGHVTVEDHAILAGLSAVHQFVRIGRNAFVGGMSGIAQDLPPFMLAVGNRAGVHGPNLVGLRRAKASRDLIAALKSAYRLIWHSETPRKEALEQLEYEYGNFPEVLNFVEFIRSSERGILSVE
ncbi:Acyl-(acyl-carrier-protein)--UDP-N-acetylglucosamine O-acyltransferase [Oleidesulfovibrio alaskensis G20]|uniref:Acyl-[acyl-carrier-protein]--UDP-N-acetylglucosamine O-acyltransferase n=1 Tax=Oleidesulfovibrio alaskensis (strain ATCC BAA-1058 / DSM 17464 / G20) TaxID=207559 RepID=Q312H1_OLEA2|nr:acyl-ACP--UDP-N-acetylglucosamine O-acyltransferase [Oleidesulfovibrio alaskensis]ABB38175.1 Acyl-(acyl-carrier-protein)--UDP-N-acetylglucosamine O-acyltransferase [Oleidesulfovibrio alaskensis G20]MBG0774458.1 acyl-ACP--UDP-N-acetylglucosamine O-acyltransferase [Oleidesulfovibrio alaskensis]